MIRNALTIIFKDQGVTVHVNVDIRLNPIKPPLSDTDCVCA